LSGQLHAAATLTVGTEFTDRRLSATGAMLVAMVKRQICVPSLIEA